MLPSKLFLFGVPRIERGGQAVPISIRKTIALFTFLAVTSRPHSRDVLATLLWPEDDQTRARANLRRELHRLKQVLGDHVLLVEREQVCINPEGDLWLDISEFESKVAQAYIHGHESHTQAGSPICETCLVSLTEAAGLYKDDFMAGFSLPDSPAFDEWQFFQAEGLRQSLSTALQQLIGWHAARGDYGQAIDYARRWLALDSLHEPAHRQLMELYALSGQHSAALRQYKECVQILEEELGVGPEGETIALYEAIRTRQFSPLAAMEVGTPEKLVHDPRHSSPHNLPLPSTPFIGRDKELSEIQEFLLDNLDARLLTILGPGGIGKTRLALEVARSIQESSAQPVYFIPLAQLPSHDQIIFSIAESLGFQFIDSGEPRQQFLDYLHGQQLLLVLDNFEHLLEGVGLLADILRIAPQVKILATSREKLDLEGEIVYVLGSLPYPLQHGDEEILQYEAVKLLLQSARLSNPQFQLQAEDFQAIVRLCRLVEGIPLALVLAAGWLGVLSLDEIVAEISHSMDILETEMRDRPERQRSMRAVLDYSWNRLPAEHQQAYLRMSIFRGGFSRKAAQTIAGADLKTLRQLLNKSWLHRDPKGRYQIHELLRQYSEEKLTKEGAAWRQVHTAHSLYYVDLLNQLERDIRGPRQGEAFQTIADEFENIRAAWQWLVKENQSETAIDSLLPALFRYCEAREKVFEVLPLIQLACSEVEANVKGNTGQRNLAILLTAQAAFYRNGPLVRFEIFGVMLPAEEDAIKTAWAIAKDLDILRDLGPWGITLSYLYGRIIDLEEGIGKLRQLIPQLREKGNRWELGYGLQHLIQLLELDTSADADHSVIEAYICEALDIFEELGDVRESAYAWLSYGNLRRIQADFQQANQCYQKAQEKYQSVWDWSLAADINWKLGDIHLQLGDFESAFRYYRQMSQTYSEAGRKRLAAYALSKESFEALRYSETQHAMEARQLSLTLSTEARDVFGESWSTWEMGEIYRVMGDYTSAHRWYESARILFERVADRSGYIFYHRGLGDIALAKEDYVGASKEFRESLEYARRVNHDWGMSYAQSGLGRAALGLGEFDTARGHLADALQRAKMADDRAIALVALVGIAELFAATGAVENAFDLAALILSNRLSWRETKGRAAALIESAGTYLPQDTATAVGERTLDEDLWSTAERILAIFAEKQLGPSE